jgi:hypothetical protein
MMFVLGGLMGIRTPYFLGSVWSLTCRVVVVSSLKH